MKGTVKWFNTKKGYGFIQPEGGNKDVFVHVTALEKTGLRRLFDGQVVSFDIYDDRGQCCRKHNNTEIIIFIKAGDPAVFPCGDFYAHLRIFLPKVQF